SGADEDQSARRQGRGRVRNRGRASRRDECDQRRAGAVRRAQYRDAGDAGPRLAGDQGRRREGGGVTEVAVRSAVAFVRPPLDVIAASISVLTIARTTIPAWGQSRDMSRYPPNRIVTCRAMMRG